MNFDSFMGEAEGLGLTIHDLLPGLRGRLAEVREAKNQVCIHGHLDRALDGVLRASSPDEVRAILTELAHISVEIAFVELGKGAPAPRCTLPPEGWSCSRTPGHDGPCAARPAAEPG